MENKNILGKKIAFYRDELRLSRPAFIKELNKIVGSTYTSQALYSWETGKSTPPADLIPYLAQLLGINILQLFGDTDIADKNQLFKINDELLAEVQELKKEVEKLTHENHKLEGKLEVSMSFLNDMMNRQDNKNDKG